MNVVRSVPGDSVCTAFSIVLFYHDDPAEHFSASDQSPAGQQPKPK